MGTGHALDLPQVDHGGGKERATERQVASGRLVSLAGIKSH